MIINTNNFRRRRTAQLFGLGQLNINPTTIWTPQTGFLNQPGTLTKGFQNQVQPTSVYDVPGLLLPYQSCLDATGGSSGSEACVNQNLATEQENFRRTAAYNAGTLQLPTNPTPVALFNPPPPPTTSTPTSTQNQVNVKSPATQTQQMTSAITVGGHDISSLVSASTKLAGFDIPYWAIGIAGLGLLYVLGGRH